MSETCPQTPHRAARALVTALMALAMGLAFTLTPAPASAQGEAELIAALGRAMESYDSLALTEAEKEIEDALSMAERLGKKDGPLAAQLYIFLGIVRHPLSGDAAAAAAFRQALEIDRNAALPTDYSTPTLNTLIEAERAALPPDKPIEPIEPIEPVVTPTRPRLDHTPVNRATAGEPLVFEADIPSTVPVYRVLLHYRRFGEAKFRDAEMRPKTDTRFALTLLGEDVCSSQLDYFIQVIDRTGDVLATEGVSDSPLTVPILGAEGPCTGVGAVVDPPIVDDNERQYVFLQVGPGSGAGLVLEGSTPVVNPDAAVSPGASLAPFHIMAELGFILTPSLNLSATFRGQLVFLTDGVELEPIFGGKLRWWFDNEGDFIMYTAVGGGFGFVRHLITVALAEEQGDFVDTIRHGPGHVGAGFGFGYAFNPHIALVFDVYPMVLFPEVSAHLDSSLSLRTSF